MLRRAICTARFQLHRCSPVSSTLYTHPHLVSPIGTSFANSFSQHRCFFFGSGSDNDDDDKKGGDKKKEDEQKKDDDKKEDESSDKPDNDAEKEKDKEPSPTLDNSSKYKSRGNNVLLPASRLGFGDQAPRYPHLMALPVIRGPVFPGVLTPVAITDKVSEQLIRFIFSFNSCLVFLT